MLDHPFLAPGRFRLRSDIFLVPAASDAVTSLAARNGLMTAGLIAGEFFWPGMSQTRAPQALRGVSHRAMGYAPGSYDPREGWTMMPTAPIVSSTGPATTSGSLGGRH
jgi:hypothetical protein